MNAPEQGGSAITAAGECDWQAFRTMAQQEGWRVPQNELALHAAGGCSQSWAIRHHGATTGLVTALRHRRSAWIGNLIIAPEMRRRGYGVALFEHALQVLRNAGTGTLWLTASAQGEPLYRARGFRRIGSVERWVRKEGGKGERPHSASAQEGVQADKAIWGDDRCGLLSRLALTGSWLQEGESYALLQGGEEMQIIGPWSGSRQERDDELLLKRLVAAASPTQEVVIDLLGSSGKQDLLRAAGFAPCGETGLMISGPEQVEWSRLLALATLGSCG